MENTKNAFEFEHRLLDRCKQDCEYYLGNGNGQDKWLWGKNVEAHIAKMRELYNLLPEKPEWLTKKDITAYETRMLDVDVYNKAFEELRTLTDDNPPPTANYWITDSINIFGYIEDNGDEDCWICLQFEKYDADGDMIELKEFATDDVNQEELSEQLEDLLHFYRRNWR